MLEPIWTPRVALGLRFSQHVNGARRVLHGHGAQPHVVLGVLLRQLGDVVVQEPRQIDAILGFGPVREHDRNGANHLNLHARLAILLDPLFGVPAVGPDFPEEHLVPHHVGKPLSRWLEVDESAVAEFLRPTRHDLGQNVRVCVDFEHEK